MDDSRTDLYLASQVAKSCFTEIALCGTPGEFRAALRVSPLPVLILMDVHLGDLHNGISEMASLKEQDTEASVIPVIVVTASTDESLHAFALRNGAEAVIVKPLTAEKLAPYVRLFAPESIKEGA